MMARLWLLFIFFVSLHGFTVTKKYYSIQAVFFSFVESVKQGNFAEATRYFQSVENFKNKNLAIEKFAQVIEYLNDNGFQYEETTIDLVRVPLKDKAIYLMKEQEEWLFTRHSLSQHENLLKTLQYFQSPNKTMNFFLEEFERKNYQVLESCFAPLTQLSKESKEEFKQSINEKNLEKFYKVLNYFSKNKKIVDIPSEKSKIIPYQLKNNIIYFIKINNDWLFSPETRKNISVFHKNLNQFSFLGLFYHDSKWIMLAIIIIIGLLSQIIVVKLCQKITKNELRKKFRQTLLPLIYSIIAYPMIQSLNLGEEIKHYSTLVVNFMVIIFTSRLGLLSVDLLISFSSNLSLSKQRYKNLTNIISKFIKFIILVIALLFITAQAGINITGLLAGIGIGGLAFALAAKDTIENILGSFTILFDAPFSIGDYIQVNDIEGTVEDIGLRSIKIRTFYGSFISLPNANIIKAKINNFSKRPSRRVKTTISITYDTPPKKIEDFCQGTKDIILKHPLTNKEKLFVHFNKFSASSLDILLYFFIETADWDIELKERQIIFLDILKLAHQLDVEFAFPTQTVHLEKNPQG